MRKKYFRYLMAQLKASSLILKWKYVDNMKIFESDVMKLVIINCYRQQRIRVYYYHKPTKTLTKSGNYKIGKFDVAHHNIMFQIIIKNIEKLTNDEIYRKYWAEISADVNKKRERH